MRKSGILMHISSLPSPYGIGTLGKEAYAFIDFLKKAGQTYWQVLPICPSCAGNSPYSAFCGFAGNPYYIDFDLLAKEGLLLQNEYQNINFGQDLQKVDFGLLSLSRMVVLNKAVNRFEDNDEYYEFIKTNSFWLDDYALFMTAYEQNDQKEWTLWPDEYRDRDKQVLDELRNNDNYRFYSVLQYFFFKQWYALKQYANDMGIEIIGDLPIYVAANSSEAWSNRELFRSYENGHYKEVAGVPPDGFSPTGQKWMNPLYDWNYHKSTGYKWWTKRVDYMCHIFDIFRLDHFRGFDEFFVIPNPGNANDGHWEKGPGMDLISLFKGRYRIIAEDLGYQTDSLKQFLVDSSYPGMKVLAFAFEHHDPNSPTYKPHAYPKNCIAYTGTHDNNTIVGWCHQADIEDIKIALNYYGLDSVDKLPWVMMESIWASSADTTIVQVQDILNLGEESRMNDPSIANDCWKWRCLNGVFSDELATKLVDYMKKYDRI